MLKRRLKYFFFSILLVFVGCAPRVAPPPAYKDMDLSLEEVILIVSKDVDALKAIAGINIEKDNEPYSYVKASVLIKRPDWMRIRTYKFGIVVGSFLIKDNVVYASSGKGVSKLKEFGGEFYHSILWWDKMGNGIMYKEGAEYIIKTGNKEIHLNRATLLPVSQEITAGNRNIHIMYDEPEREGDFWYPSVMRIEIDAYRFTIKIEKLILNPPLGENDFNLK